MNEELIRKLKQAGFNQREDLLISADDISSMFERDVALLFQREGCGYHRTFDLSLSGYPETEPDYFTQGKFRASSIFSKEYLESEIGKKETVYFPTLEELIEACGEKLGEMENVSLQFYPKKEIAFAYIRMNEISEGKTPLIAVANLFISLSKK